MGSEELAANLFRITQTESRLKRDNIQTESAANKTHYEVGSKIKSSHQMKTKNRKLYKNKILCAII